MGVFIFFLSIFCLSSVFPMLQPTGRNVIALYTVSLHSFLPILIHFLFAYYANNVAAWRNWCNRKSNEKLCFSTSSRVSCESAPFFPFVADIAIDNNWLSYNIGFWFHTSPDLVGAMVIVGRREKKLELCYDFPTSDNYRCASITYQKATKPYVPHCHMYVDLCHRPLFFLHATEE